MARKTFVEMIDDISGETADTTVLFGLEGVEYEIDLTEENAEKLREAVGFYAEKARRVGGRARRGAGAAPRGNSDAAKVREWARENGYDVPDRGRIPSEIREAYEAGTPANKPAEKASTTPKADNKPAEASTAEKAAEKPADDKKPAAPKKAEAKTGEKTATASA